MVQQVGGNKLEKKENPKPVDERQKADSLESWISKPKQKSKMPASKTTTFKPATTKVMESSEDKVSQSVYKQKMTNGQDIKWAEKGHIQTDCKKG